MTTGNFIWSGLRASITVIVLDVLLNSVIFAAEEQAAIASLASDPAMLDSPVTLAVILGVDIVIGFLLVWTYVAIRPRFGSGPRTALVAAIQIWLVSILPWTILTYLGALPWSFWGLQLPLTLMTYAIGALIGGKWYRGEGTGAR